MSRTPLRCKWGMRQQVPLAMSITRDSGPKSGTTSTARCSRCHTRGNHDWVSIREEIQASMGSTGKPETAMMDGQTSKLDM
jgi:hypothetical protein